MISRLSIYHRWRRFRVIGLAFPMTWCALSLIAAALIFVVV